MTTVDTRQELVVFPQTLRKRNIALLAGLAILSAVLLPVGWAEANWIMVGLSGFIALLCGGLALRVFRRYRRGTPDPALTLSPQGLYLMTGTTGLIPWTEITGLGLVYVGSNKALVVNVTKGAIGRLEESPFFKASRKLDTALGIHALLFFQTNVEVPLHDLADMIHDYSIAHGGPALQPNRTP